MPVRVLPASIASRASRNANQFRRRMPIADYEYFRPYIEEVKAGRPEALLGPKNRLLMFSLTSGTTAQAKYIPITERFLADYRSGWQVWGIQAFNAHPGINSRNILQLSSDYDLFRTPGGTPCGNISGLVAACQKRIVRTMYTVPGAVAKIRNSDAKLYTAMRLAVADRNIGMVTTANPSTLIQLARLADSRKDDLIRDIAEGTLVGSRKCPRRKCAAILHGGESHGKTRLAPASWNRSSSGPAICCPAISGPRCSFWPSGRGEAPRVSAGPPRRLRCMSRSATTGFRPAKGA